jgi:quercetin dioxygenase-like cupin family protein
MGDSLVTVNWCSGNAAEDTKDNRGWLLGHFIDPSEGVLHSKDVEVKWATHRAGEQRHEWTADDQRTTLLVLIQGEFRVDLTEGSKTLSTQGDYVLWGPGIDHSYEALTDAVVMVVRWPSAT